MSRQLIYLALGAGAVLLSACQTMEQDRRRAMGLPLDVPAKADVRTIVREAPVAAEEGAMSAQQIAIRDAQRDCARQGLEPRRLNVQRETLPAYARHQGQTIERVHLHYLCERGLP